MLITSVSDCTCSLGPSQRRLTPPLALPLPLGPSKRHATVVFHRAGPLDLPRRRLNI